MAQKKTEVDGIKFDSLMESEYYTALKYQEMAREVKILSLQPKIYMTDARILFKPDFLVLRLSTGTEEYHEVKGFETPVYRLKKRLFKHYGKGKLRVIKKLKGRFEITEEVICKPC